MENPKDIRGIYDLLEKQLGYRYRDIIELEFDIGLEQFIHWFIDCDEYGCYFTTI